MNELEGKVMIVPGGPPGAGCSVTLASNKDASCVAGHSRIVGGGLTAAVR